MNILQEQARELKYRLKDQTLEEIKQLKQEIDQLEKQKEDIDTEINHKEGRLHYLQKILLTF